MFTGIIETLGIIRQVERERASVHFRIESDITHQLKPDQSIAHSGVCLTVTSLEEESYWVTAVNETLRKTNSAGWLTGTNVNLERSMPNDGRFDGHIVQGHTDQVGTCVAIKEEAGGYLFDFQYDPTTGNVTVEKGSIAVNGISLTCFNSIKNRFTVAIIPYTYAHTTMHELTVGAQVNLEFDIVGKYIQQLMSK